MFQHVDTYWIIESEDQIKFYLENQCPNWIINGPWYKSKFFSHYNGFSFKDYFTTSLKERYNLMCFIKAYEKLYQTCDDSASSGDEIIMTDRSTTYELLSLGHTLNFIAKLATII